MKKLTKNDLKLKGQVHQFAFAADSIDAEAVDFKTQADVMAVGLKYGKILPKRNQGQGK